MLNYFWVAAGGAIGSLGRFWVSGMVARHFGETFPLGTLLVNVSGSFLIGFFASLTDPDGRWLVSPTVRVFFMAGFCGGYTTFSSFSLQTMELASEGQWLYAGINSVLSFALCVFAVWAGYVIASGLNS